MTHHPWSERLPLRNITTLDDLRARFPRWRIERIEEHGTYRWIAYDNDNITVAEYEAGCEQTVEAAASDDLWDKLLDQERLRGRS